GASLVLTANVDSTVSAGNFAGKVDFCASTSPCTNLNAGYLGCAGTGCTTGGAVTAQSFDSSSGIATLTLSTPLASFTNGTPTAVRAGYSGGGNYAPSGSSSINVTVNQASALIGAPSTTVGGGTVSSVTFGTSITLSATVSSTEYCNG